MQYELRIDWVISSISLFSRCSKDRKLVRARSIDDQKRQRYSLNDKLISNLPSAPLPGLLARPVIIHPNSVFCSVGILSLSWFWFIILLVWFVQLIVLQRRSLLKLTGLFDGTALRHPVLSRYSEGYSKMKHHYPSSNGMRCDVAIDRYLSAFKAGFDRSVSIWRFFLGNRRVLKNLLWNEIYLRAQVEVCATKCDISKVILYQGVGFGQQNLISHLIDVSMSERPVVVLVCEGCCFP